METIETRSKAFMRSYLACGAKELQQGMAETIETRSKAFMQSFLACGAKELRRGTTETIEIWSKAFMQSFLACGAKELRREDGNDRNSVKSIYLKLSCLRRERVAAGRWKRSKFGQKHLCKVILLAARKSHGGKMETIETQSNLFI